MSVTRRMVAGFMFSTALRQVVLIRKNRPEWMAGLLNGVGGHIEPTDASPEAAMRREFLEETGVDHCDWLPVCLLSGSGWQVHFFAAIGPVLRCSTMTDEPSVWCDYASIVQPNSVSSPGFVPNLSWLVPLARLRLRGEAVFCHVLEEPQVSK